MLHRRLVIRPGAIGDFLLSLPALRALDTGAMEVWCASANLPLAPFAAHRESIAASGIDLVGVGDLEISPRLVERLRCFDSIVSWYGAARPEFRAALDALRLPATFLQALPEAGTHATDFFLGQVAELQPLRESAAIPRVDVPQAERHGVVLHPYSGSSRKNWPLEGFRELAARLGQLQPVRWCAGPGDPLPADLAADAIRIDDLGDLAAELGAARLFIGNDSGITHLAAAAGTSTIALFGPTAPEVWAPRGAAVSIVRSGGADGAMAAIPVSAVFDAARALLL